MREAKSFASLSPSLLARKGGARPAMRHQLQPHAASLPKFEDNAARQIDEDDLGWNDHGHDTPAMAAQPAPEAEIVALTGVVPASPRIPEVVHQRNAVAERIGEEIAAERNNRRSALAEGRRAAFTLRLDAERHLKLRLACTLENRSAQQIVTAALDRMLAGMPEVGALADQVRKCK